MAKRDTKTNPAEGVELTLSASQLNTAWSCYRKWWFEKVLKLPQVSRGFLTFGTVLHAVLERWLLADGKGYGPDGKPMDLYPEGWTKADGGEVSPAEGALIRKLVQVAIEKGYVERIAGRKMEHEFRLPVIDGVDITGFIDLYLPDGIDDFKSSKNRNYLKQSGPKEKDGTPIPLPGGEGPKRSPNCVGDEPQMLTYGYVRLLDQQFETPIRLRHIQFVKDTKDKEGVRVAEAFVTPEKLLEHWDRVKKTAAELLALKRDTKIAWAKVPGPSSADSCMAYGGCPFLGVCGGTESPEMLKQRVTRLLPQETPQAATPAAESTSTIAQQGTPMTKDIFAKRPAGINSVPPTKTVDTTAVVTAPSRVAPWVRPECKACAPKDAAGNVAGPGTGINSNQKPCLICDSMQKKAGGVTSSQFGLTHDEKGQLQWQAGGGTIPANATAIVAPAVAPQVAAAPAAPKGKDLFKKPKAPKEQAEQGAPQKAESKPTEPDAAPSTASAVVAPEVTTEETPEPEPEKRAVGGRPKTGFTLLIDAAWFAGPQRKVVTLASVIAECDPEFYTRDEFPRRKMIQQAADKIADQLGNQVVLASSGDPDSKALIQALIPHAGMVITGTR